jgi:hypothetical protein
MPLRGGPCDERMRAGWWSPGVPCVRALSNLASLGQAVAGASGEAAVGGRTDHDRTVHGHPDARVLRVARRTARRLRPERGRSGRAGSAHIAGLKPTRSCC